MLELARVSPQDLVVDVGCGDGRVVAIAALEYGARAIGVEIRKDFAQLALHNLVKVGVRSRGEIICGDFMCIDLAKHLL